MSITDTWPFTQIAQNYAIAYDYDSNGNLIYQGWSQPGALKTDTAWRIMHQVFNASNKVTDLGWAQSSTAFNYVWALRTQYNYGISPAQTSYTAIVLTSPNTTRWTIIPNTSGNLVTTPQASGPAGAYDIGGLTLIDINNVFWGVTISNAGNLITTSGASPVNALDSILVLDASLRAWTLTVNTIGDLVTS